METGCKHEALGKTGNYRRRPSEVKHVAETVKGVSLRRKVSSNTKIIFEGREDLKKSRRKKTRSRGEAVYSGKVLKISLTWGEAKSKREESKKFLRETTYCAAFVWDCMGARGKGLHQNRSW